jgi:adenylate kinase
MSTLPTPRASVHARVNIIFIGPPGSGKGTQAVRIAERYRIPHISTGDILRAAVKARSELGRQVAATLAGGGLVGDGLMTDLVRSRLGRSDAKGGFLLDGFPRTVTQAQTLEEMLPGAPLIVALISVADDAIIQRLSNRRICEACNITQSVFVGSEGENEACPYCGGRLVRRQDDAPATIRRRLENYAAFADPLIEYYRARPSFAAIDGLQQPNRVTAALTAHIDRQRGALRSDPASTAPPRPPGSSA